MFSIFFILLFYREANVIPFIPTASDWNHSVSMEKQVALITNPQDEFRKTRQDEARRGKARQDKTRQEKLYL